MINTQVHVTSNRGHTPEELADMAVNRIIAISEDASPAIKAQAEAFRNELHGVLVQYMTMAVKSYKTTLTAELSKRGQTEAAQVVQHT